MWLTFFVHTVELEQQQQRTKAAPRDRQKIEFGALLPTVCKRCGGQGHLASECFNIGGEKYDLIPEPKGEEPEEKPYALPHCPTTELTPCLLEMLHIRILKA